ncbi:lipase [Backusella circina FSU 941]|nr:lipase [Backusella circina FSU 941]
MATYLELLPEVTKLLESLPPEDPDQEITTEALRNIPDSEVPYSYERPDVTSEELYVLSPNGMVSVTMYRPYDTKNKKIPALIFIHGGGWCMRKTGAYPFLTAKFAGGAQCAVIFVKYTLSPEVRFPVATEECYSVLQWASNPSNSFLNIDTNNIAVGGDSAGGNLSIAVALMAKQRQLETKIKQLLLFYPVTNHVFNTASYYEFNRGFRLSRKNMEFVWDQYIPKKEDRDNILASPLRATKEDLEDFPPTFIVSAEADVLRDEAEVFARNLMKANVPVVAQRALGQIHGFISVSDLVIIPSSIAIIDQATGILVKAFAS